MPTVRRCLVAVAVGAAVSIAVPPALAIAQDGGRPLSTGLSGANEVPPADTDGSGTAKLRLNPGQGAICYELEVTNIALPATGAHIHVAPAGVNGPIVVPLRAPGADGESSACAEVNRALIRAILHSPESYYVNVHTTEYPGGAVRGQLG